MFKSNFILLLFCAAFSAVQAQSDEAPVQKASSVLLRLHPLGFIDLFDQNLSAGLEFRSNSNWSAGIDAGVILNSIYFLNSDQVSGVIIRPFARHYKTSNPNQFLELQGHFKSARYRFEDFHFNKNVAGVHLLWGKSKAIGKRKRNRVEYYAGVGLRGKWQSRSDGSDVKPSSLTKREGGQEFPRTSFAPALPAGIRFVFPLQ